jgi:hypothetical protein
MDFAMLPPDDSAIRTFAGELASAAAPFNSITRLRRA